MAVDPIALARELIDIPSPSGQEAPVASLLERRLSALGFSCRYQTIEGDRANLFASAGGTPRVILCSHMDTVPPFFPSREESGLLYGRGACDTKGIIAAMIAASERLLGEGRRDFALLLVVAEETDSIGAKRANEELANHGCEYVVVGEPTESKFASASKGAFTSTARFSGLAAHSAYPERGDSAILKMAAAIRDIAAADWGRDPLLGEATVNVGVVRGGIKPNIIAGEAEAEMMFRTVSEPRVIQEQLETILSRYDGAIVRMHGNPPMKMISPPGRPSTVVAFNTDLPHLGKLGKPLLFGPGSILDAHGADEKISKRELLEAIETYRQLVVDLLDGKVS